MEHQSGFRPGRSCIDNIVILRQLSEKKAATNREIHLLFVDITKAYDNVPICKLWQVLEQSNINNTLIKAIKNIYAQSISKVKIGNAISASFPTSKGLRQGCCLSPTLFKIYLDRALQSWRRACGGMGVELDEETTLYTLHFADDQIVVAQDYEDLEFMSNRLFKEYKNWGLPVNVEKSKYLCVGGEQQDILLNSGQKIEGCTEYIYLGTKVDKSGRTEKEIEERIIKAKQIVGALNPILWSKNISADRKHHIYNAIFKSTLLYGCECWQLTKRLETRLLAVEMDYWRRSAGISRIQRVTNNRVREIMKVQTTIIEDIQERQLCWYGHVERMGNERLPKLIMKWVPPERRRRGRPKVTWIGGIQRTMSKRNLQVGDWKDRRRRRQETGRRPTL